MRNMPPFGDLEPSGDELKPVRLGFGTRLRNYFLAGLVIAAPVSITIYLTWSFISIVDKWVKPLIPARYNPEHYLPFSVPGLGVIFAILGITLIGFLAANLFGRSVLAYGEMLVHRTPLISSVYKALKQIFETVLAQGQTSFNQVGLVEYPRRGLYAMVFIATTTKGEVSEKLGEDGGTYSVFLPTTPNPTSGFLLFVPKDDVILLDMTVEDAAKMVISAGLVAPDYKGMVEKLANGKKTVPTDAPEPVALETTKG